MSSIKKAVHLLAKLWRAVAVLIHRIEFRCEKSFFSVGKPTGPGFKKYSPSLLEIKIRRYPCRYTTSEGEEKSPSSTTAHGRVFHNSHHWPEQPLICNWPITICRRTERKRREKERKGTEIDRKCWPISLLYYAVAVCTRVPWYFAPSSSFFFFLFLALTPSDFPNFPH